MRLIGLLFNVLFCMLPICYYYHTLTRIQTIKKIEDDKLFHTIIYIEIENLLIN